MVLARYRMSKRFGEYLKAELGFDLHPLNLNNLTIPELDYMINDIKFCISCKNVGNFWQDAATKGVGAIESFVSPYYNVTGLSKVLEQDDTYCDAVEEMVLENQHYLYTKSQYRLMYLIAKNAIKVHGAHLVCAELAKTP